MLRRALREPLFRFLVVGAAIFAADRALAARAPPGAGRRIVIERSFVDGLAADQQRRTGSPPDARMRAELVRGYVREEVLFREALALGLDRGDPVVRRRLVQKTELWLQATSALPERGDAELLAYERAHASRYRDEARTSFEHVFFADAAGTSREAATTRAAAALAAPIDAHSGDPFAAGRAFTRLRDGEARRLFGDAFVEALATVPVGASRWYGPLAGRFGEHLVRVTERLPERLPPLAEVRSRVRRDEAEDAQRAAVERRTRALVATYEVVTR